MLNEADLLNHIRQTTEMGVSGITMVLENTNSSSLRQALEQQKEEYQKIYRSADEMLRDYGGSPTELNAFAKLSSELTSAFQTRLHSSPSKIAEMMIQGNTRGMTKSLQCLNEYIGEEKSVISLAKTLLETEEANIEQMKPFL